MIDAEIHLLETVRDHLRDHLNIDVEVEPDENVPAIAGQEYMAVIPAGVNPGPRHNTSGGVWDLLIPFRVLLFQRITHQPRDRRRNVVMDRLKGLNARLGEATRCIDFSNAILAQATASIQHDKTVGQFVECPRFSAFDVPRTVSFEVYDARRDTLGDPIIAMRRGVRFDRTRFMEVRQ